MVGDTGDTTQVLVIGGGISGSVAALALAKAGFAVTLCEAHPSAAADLGAFLTLASNGMVALAQLDAAKPISGVGFPLTEMRLLDQSGAEVATTLLGEHQDPLAQFRCLRWSELSAALQAQVRQRGIPLRHSARLVDAVADTRAVTVRFDDGTSLSADLLIGADGLNSTLRTLIDPAAGQPRYAGQRVFYGYADDTGLPGGTRITMVRGSRSAFGYAVSPAGTAYWFARLPGTELTPEQIAGTSPDQWRTELLDVLQADATPAADIVAATGDQLLVTNACDLPDLRRWSTDRMLLIGDAAHAASPATGQGASMAMEDAVVLAKALRDNERGQALELYERIRRPRVQQNITVSARLTAGHQPAPQPASTTSRFPRADPELMHQLDWNTPLS
ncbi:MAG TPA: NAD(P)/FAD-dependent oxidoreductase [Kineosporiaceae bacterium]|nr:NAD(P)/FAD-dependent oxidoreductase [Kineosporiaceae bacterium]